MFRMQLSAGFAIIEGLLSVGLSNDGQTIAATGMIQGILSLALGLLIAYQSVRQGRAV